MTLGRGTLESSPSRRLDSLTLMLRSLSTSCRVLGPTCLIVIAFVEQSLNELLVSPSLSVLVTRSSYEPRM